MRNSGVLMHISSLPSYYGIGAMGKEAMRFADFLADAGQTYWQILPIHQTGFGDSPYQSPSTFAGNPYFIDLDILASEGLLEESEYKNFNWGDTPGFVDYGLMYENRYKVLRKAAGRLSPGNPDFIAFCDENDFWLSDYALFMALKDVHDGISFDNWEESLKLRDESALESARQKYSDDINFWKAVQYLFFKQWKALKKYANERGIRIFGDLPIYVSLDSADVWAHPEQFELDENLHPKAVAGVPPDYFCEDGQLWGNPLYNWDEMSKDGYSWWISRLSFLCGVYDVVRLDHFLGFNEYYCIPYGNVNAKRGYWKKGPGLSFFETVRSALGDINLIAENLGIPSEGAVRLMEVCGFRGMKVLEFAFDANNISAGAYHLPHNYDDSTVAYIGTHDNDTALGWIGTVNQDDLELAVKYLGLNKEEGFVWGMMRGLWSSKAALTIIQAQDLLELGSLARMNTPSTTTGNWRWRALSGSFTPELAAKLRYCMEMYER